MKVLFDIRGRQILCETDPTIPHDTVRVRSIDAFAALLSTIDDQPAAEVEFGVHGKNSTQPLRQRSPRKIAASAIIEVPPDICPPTPEFGWRDGQGRKLILNNFGITREQVARAIAKRPERLSPEMTKLLSLRFGIGNPNARPHSTEEVAVAFGYDKIGKPTTGQALVSTQVKKALRALNLRPKTLRHRSKQSK